MTYFLHLISDPFAIRAHISVHVRRLLATILTIYMRVIDMLGRDTLAKNVTRF